MSKPSTHDLPPLTHTFGKANVLNEGAKGLVQDWQVHKNSEREKRAYDYMKLNKLCVTRKSPSEIKTYRENHDYR